MLRWRFLTYVAPSGRNDTQNEVNRYHDYAREAFQRAVAHLAVANIDKWDEPHAKKLKGRNKLYEVRYPADNCATRAVGFFGPGPNQFTITLICTHKQNVYKPHDAIATAGRRAEQIQAGSATVAALQIDGEDFPANDEAP